MNNKVRILHLEDSYSDAQLVRRILTKNQVDFEMLVVETEDQFVHGLTDFTPDIVIADHTLPSFNSHKALQILQQTELKIPFILISATISEEFAVDVIKRGADDYILKDRLERLPSAIYNSLEKSRLEDEKLEAERLSKDSEERYRSFFENCADGILLTVTDGEVFAANPAACKLFQMTEQEIIKAGRLGLVDLADPRVNKGIDERQRTGRVKVEITLVRKDGSKFPGEINSNVFNDANGKKQTSMIIRDLTEWKSAEAKLYQANRLFTFISQINQTIVHSQDEQTVFKEACRIAVDNGFRAAWIGTLDAAHQRINLIEACGIPVKDILSFTDVPGKEMSPQQFVLKKGTYYICNDVANCEELGKWKEFAGDAGISSVMMLPLRKSGNVIGTFNLYAGEVDFFTSSEIILLEEAAADISFALDIFEKQEQKLISDDLLKHNELRLNQAQAIAHLGSWELNFATGVLVLSEEALRIYGLPLSESRQTYQSWVSYIHPDDLERVSRLMKEADTAQNNLPFLHRIFRKDGTVRYVSSQANYEFGSEGKPTGLYGVTHDITEKKEAEDALRNSETNLKAIFENSSDGFILAGLDGIIKSFNSKSKDIIYLNTGQQLNVGNSIFDFIHPSRKDRHENAIEKVLSGETLQYDYQYQRKNGDLKWFDFTINPVYAAGKVAGLSITSTDITKRKQAEELLQVSESNLNAIIENNDAFIYSLDRDFKYVKFNNALKRSMKELYGVDIKVGYHIFNFIEEFDPAEAREWRNTYTKGLNGETVKFEKEFFLADHYSCVSFSIHPIWENENVIGVSCISYDITKQKMAEEATRQNELRYRQIVETAQEGIWTIDEKHITSFVNDKMCEILEYSSGEMIGRQIFDFMDDEGKKTAAHILERRKDSNKQSFDLKFISKSNNAVWTRVSTNAIFGTNSEYSGTLAMISDITQQHDLKNLLDKTNQLARIGSWEVDIENQSLYWSAMTRDIHEVDEDFVPVLESAIEFYKAGQSRETIIDAVQQAIETGASFDMQLQIVTARGNERWVKVIGSVEYIEGKCIKINGSFQDIDGSKRAELDVLRAYEEKNIILESIADGFFAVDKNWIVTYWNQQAEKLLKVSKTDTMGQNLWELFKDSLNTESYKKYHEAIETNQVTHFTDYYPTLHLWYEISAYPSANGLSVFFRDITNQKLLEIERVKITTDLIGRNKDLEQFSYIVSHNLRAPVANIIGLSQMLQNNNIRESLKQPIISGLSLSSNKLDEVIKDLNNILKVRQELNENKQTVNFTKLVKDLKVNMDDTRTIEKPVINCDFSEVDEMLTIKSYLHSIFYNLISNSIKYRRQDTPAILNIKSQQLQDKIVLIFKDNGVGIDLAKRGEQVFGLYKRFHTGQAEGKGIGLYMVKTQVESMGGKISISSEVNKGTEFRIEFDTKEY